MVLLIDANILLDVLQNRQPFVTDSELIWKLCETEQVQGYVSTLTFANIIYIMRKNMNPDMIKAVYNKLKLIFYFTSLDYVILQNAVNMKWDDYEDAVQSATAEKIRADYIITRNTRDFVNSKITASTPNEFLQNFARRKNSI